MEMKRTEEKSTILEDTENADKFSCRATLSSELYMTPSSMSSYEIYQSINENEIFKSRFFKIENFLRFGVISLNHFLGLELGEEDDMHGIGEIISVEVVKLLSIVSGTIEIFFHHLQVRIEPKHAASLNCDVHRSDLNIIWGNCIVLLSGKQILLQGFQQNASRA